MKEDLLSLREQEKKAYSILEEQSPQSLQRPELPSPQALLSKIGINHTTLKPSGFIRLYSEDFIVEEIGLDERVSTIEPRSTPVPERTANQKTLYVDLVKIGLGTIDTVAELAKQLQIQPQQIGYAGLKDNYALTSQRLSIRGMKGQLPTIQKGQYFLNPVNFGQGILFKGNLNGNRFTLTIRTPDPVNEKKLATELQELATNGYPNFYGIQRFGNRLQNAILGKLLCQGKSDQAIKMYLCESGPYDIPLFISMREKVTQDFGDWIKMKQTFDILPSTFRFERIILDSLIKYPNQWDIAVNSIADQARFWLYSYVSYLVNEILSDVFAGTKDIPDPLPLALGHASTDEIYLPYLQRDKTENYAKHIKPYPFFVTKVRTLQPWIIPVIHNTHVTDAGVILSFDLPKGAYATTLLMFLFNIYEGTPVPSWVKTEKYDAKELLQTGSVKSALELLDTTLANTYGV